MSQKITNNSVKSGTRSLRSQNSRWKRLLRRHLGRQHKESVKPSGPQKRIRNLFIIFKHLLLNLWLIRLRFYVSATIINLTNSCIISIISVSIYIASKEVIFLRYKCINVCINHQYIITWLNDSFNKVTDLLNQYKVIIRSLYEKVKCNVSTSSFLIKTNYNKLSYIARRMYNNNNFITKNLNNVSVQICNIGCLLDNKCKKGFNKLPTPPIIIFITLKSKICTYKSVFLNVVSCFHY